MHARTKINPSLSSHISVEASHSDSEQSRVRAAQSALLTNASVTSHIIIRESVSKPVDVRRMDQSRVMLDIFRQYLKSPRMNSHDQLTFVTGFW
jgi:hypothetical protein